MDCSSCWSQLICSMSKQDLKCDRKEGGTEELDEPTTKN